MVAIVGLEDVVVVDTEDALLVMPRSRAQDVRAVVNALKSQKQDDAPLRPSIMLPTHIFREYDIRGVADRDLPDALVEDLGRALGTFLMRARRHSASRSAATAG